MKITIEEVRKVATLAHLSLDAASEERLRGELDQILEYMDKLDELDTSAVAPALGAGEEEPGLRDDRSAASLPVEEALGNAPESGGGHFKVPRVIPS